MFTPYEAALKALEPLGIGESLKSLLQTRHTEAVRLLELLGRAEKRITMGMDLSWYDKKVIPESLGRFPSNDDVLLVIDVANSRGIDLTPALEALRRVEGFQEELKADWQHIIDTRDRVTARKHRELLDRRAKKKKTDAELLIETTNMLCRENNVAARHPEAPWVRVSQFVKLFEKEGIRVSLAPRVKLDRLVREVASNAKRVLDALSELEDPNVRE